jgi:N-methylhydantoinase B
MRSKRETAGDLRAQIAANVTGHRRLGEVFDRFGADAVNADIDALIAYTRDRTALDLAKFPQGSYSAEGFVDNDGVSDAPVRLRARVVIDPQAILFDLAGSDPQRRAPVNSTFAQTFSACAYAAKCLIDQDIPVNHGFYECVRVSAPEGSVTNCRAPAPVVGGWETQTRLVDVIFRALAPVMGDRTVAGTKAMMCQAGFGGIDPRTGEYYCFYEALGGGYGARRERDGPDAVQAHGQNTENAPIEEVELNYPVRIARYELIADSDGAGRRRGGLGLRRDYQFVDHEVSFTILADRDREGPWGLSGGRSGRPAEYWLSAGETARRLGSKTTVDVPAGGVVSFRTCGGGGFGPPEQRDPELVLADVRHGKVSIERAREVYRVIVDPHTGALDAEATRRLRAAAGGGGNR